MNPRRFALALFVVAWIVAITYSVTAGGTSSLADTSSVVVTSGLKGGEVVVTAGVHALRPGQKVRLAEDKP